VEVMDVGLFDELTFMRPQDFDLPDEIDVWQTKSLQCQMDRYIVGDTRLLYLEGSLIGSTSPVFYHGVIRFYASAGEPRSNYFRWYEYEMTVTHGVVESVVEVEHWEHCQCDACRAAGKEPYPDDSDSITVTCAHCGKEALRKDSWVVRFTIQEAKYKTAHIVHFCSLYCAMYDNPQGHWPWEELIDYSLNRWSRQ